MKTSLLFKITAGLLLMTSLAAAAPVACHTQEINPGTLEPYSTAQAYNAVVKNWQSRQPDHPGMISLGKAFAVYRSEKATLNKMRNDKQAHCYAGCRISQEVNYRTAEYVAWLKEDRDVKDCKKTSHFDNLDFIATVDGAQLGQSAVDDIACMAGCKARH